METVKNGLIIGIFATQIMDVSSLIGAQLGLTGRTRPSLIGRWFSYLLRGRFTHQDIFQTPKVKGELVSGILVHYLIGAVIGVFYMTIASQLTIPKENWLFPLIFGLSTCIFPWLVLFPSCGFGFFGLKGPEIMRPLRTSVYSHFFYGLAIYIYWRIME